MPVLLLVLLQIAGPAVIKSVCRSGRFTEKCIHQTHMSSQGLDRANYAYGTSGVHRINGSAFAVFSTLLSSILAKSPCITLLKIRQSPVFFQVPLSFGSPVFRGSPVFSAAIALCEMSTTNTYVQPRTRLSRDAVSRIMCQDQE